MTGFVLAQGTHQTGCVIAEFPGVEYMMYLLTNGWSLNHTSLAMIPEQPAMS